MTLTAFFLILASVTCHAVWQIIAKGHRPCVLYYCLISATDAAFMLLIAALGGFPFTALPAVTILCFLGGGLFGALGNVGYSIAYRATDISIAYPIGRAMPVLLTALIASLFHMGKTLSLWAVIGMVIVCTGCLLLPLKHGTAFRRSDFRNRGMIGIGMAIVASVGYTLIDSVGVHNMMTHCGDGSVGKTLVLACGYNALREWTIFTAMSCFVTLRKSERSHFSREFFLHASPYVAGFIAGIAYALILMAMNEVTNVSFVQAFRQLSLPMVAILGVLFLKEKLNRIQLAGLLMILGGLVLTCLK